MQSGGVRFRSFSPSRFFYGQGGWRAGGRWHRALGAAKKCPGTVEERWVLLAGGGGLSVRFSFGLAP